MDDKELVLISKGEILVNRYDAFTDVTASDTSEIKMKGFFYTDSNGTLYGVGSKFWLEGGFFAKGNLEVNAVTGQVSASSSSKLTILEGDETKAKRRFLVNYNEKVFEDQNASLPRVTNVSVSVGPVELVK
ncbi:hypothetical protein D3C73_1328860 [compost metagenome]